MVAWWKICKSSYGIVKKRSGGEQVKTFYSSVHHAHVLNCDTNSLPNDHSMLPNFTHPTEPCKCYHPTRFAFPQYYLPQPCSRMHKQEQKILPRASQCNILLLLSLISVLQKGSESIQSHGAPLRTQNDSACSSCREIRKLTSMRVRRFENAHLIH